MTWTQDREMNARESTVQRAKVATSIAFILNGWTFATWASRIPDVRTALELTPGDLGLLLLFGAAGSLVGLPLAGWVSSRIGTRATVLVGGGLSLAGLCTAGAAAGLAHSYAFTAIALFVTLAGIGQWDVAMNLEGAAVEHHLRRNIMPRFHAGFSLGAVLAALVGAGLIAAHVPFVVHFAAMVALLGALLAFATRNFLPRSWEVGDAPDDAANPVANPDAATTSTPSPARLSARGAWLEPRTLLIGLVML
ncbi:MAG: MFS transporter, partial [Micrococcales bacterium]|nr:MFS transporter [Micrococcales bacterium]